MSNYWLAWNVDTEETAVINADSRDDAIDNTLETFGYDSTDRDAFKLTQLTDEQAAELELGG